MDRIADGAACSECWASTRIFTPTDALCSKCGLFLGESTCVGKAGRCGKCNDHQYDRAISAGVYHKALSASVLHLKRVPAVPKRVRDCLISVVPILQPADEFLIVPVPLSKKRLMERGFNQAAVLASVLADFLSKPLDERSLVRERDTQMHRAAMDEKARAATVKNVFAVVRPKLVEGKHILLVDDLLTSGATGSQCANALKKSGAARVDVVSLARAG